MLRRLTNLSPAGGRAPVAAAALVCGLRFRATNETATVKSLDQRVRALEATKSLDGLLEFYGSRSHAKFDIGTVVRRCVDPDYNTHIFCHKELPLFLAHHVRAIDCLPIGLHAMHSILDIRRHLADSFEKLIHCPLPICASSQKEFLDVVRKVHDERQDLDILRKMAMGVLELKEHLSRHTRARLTSSNQTMSHQAIYEKLLPEMKKLQDPLDECNRYFIYYSFLASQLMNLEGQDLRSSARIGTIDREIDLVNLVRGAVDDAKDICNSVYGDCPDVEIIVPESEPTTFAHKGSTIHYILLELMKNALRATVESHMTRNEAGFVNCDDMPPVRVVVMSSSNLQHSCVCIEDEGRGIPRQRMDLVMSYTYTTASKPALALLEAVDPNANHSSSTEVDMSPLAGYGFGLPVSRMYARCFGGDLTLSSMEGFGTKASLFIKSIASHETTS